MKTGRRWPGDRVDRREHIAAERADRGRFGRRGQAEDDGTQHRQDHHQQREEAGQQQLEDLQPLESQHRIETDEGDRRDRPAHPAAAAVGGRQCVGRGGGGGRQRFVKRSGGGLAGGRLGTGRLGHAGRVTRCVAGRLGRGFGQAAGVGRLRQSAFAGGRRLAAHHLRRIGRRQLGRRVVGAHPADEGDGQHQGQRQQRHAELAQHRALAAFAAERAQQRGQGRALAAAAQPLGQGRQVHMARFGRQRRHQRRLQLGQQHHVQHVQPRQHQPGKEGAGIQLHDRHAGRRAVDDQHHRRRDQDAQAAARRDGAGRDAHVVAALEHLRQGQQPHQRDDGANDAGGGREHRAGEDGGDRERAGHARHGQVQALEELVDEVGPLHEITHEDEQRDGDEHVVAHHLEGALHHQRERLAGVEVVGQPREEHAHAHQREGRREAQHDGHDDQGQHGQAEVAAGQLLGAEQHEAGAGDDDRHQHEAEPEFLANLHGAACCYSTWTICLSLSTSTSSTSCSRLGQCPCCRHCRQRTISTTPCSSSSPPASGITALNG
jgi:hypothetical protein